MNSQQQIFASKQVNRTLSPFAVMVANLAGVESAPQQSTVSTNPKPPIFLDGDRPTNPADSHAAPLLT
ncbi:MAG: hypothetical protein ABIG32_01275 [Candidatus Uhrbacteria bacterium]|nr:hypothetical protein [Patescibacteria group bacterium]MBU1907139.1 hypothetical protein [Patescibacteria group bacterium]